MSYFPDLGCTTMVASGEYVRAVGWLDHTQPFQQGVAPADFVEKLAQFVERAAYSEHVLRLVSLCGYHTCDFCGNAIGANNFGVPSGEVLFVAPVLIRHYVEAHGYLPPAEFIAAVRASPLPGTTAYSLAAAAMFDALQKRPRLGVSVKAREWIIKGRCQICEQWLYLYDHAADLRHCGRELVEITERAEEIGDPDDVSLATGTSRFPKELAFHVGPISKGGPPRLEVGAAGGACSTDCEDLEAILLDGNGQVLGYRADANRLLVAKGRLDPASLNPDVVLAEAKRRGAAGIAFFHRHANGDATPTEQDLALTRMLREAGDRSGVKVTDHMIMGEGLRILSLAAHGYF